MKSKVKKISSLTAVALGACVVGVTPVVAINALGGARSFIKRYKLC